MTTMTATTSLGRRRFGSLLLATAGAVVVRPGFGLGATDDPPAPLRTVNVRTSTQLDAALSNAQPGDHIVLANATYSGSRTLARAGTATAPIVVKAASKHGATLTGGTLSLAAPHTMAYGLRFTGNNLAVRPLADDTAVLRNWFMGPRGVMVTTAQRVRLGYNKFTGGPVKDLRHGNHIYININEGNTIRLPEGLRVYRNALSSPSGSGAAQDYMHIYIGPHGGDTNTPSLMDVVISYNRISDSIRTRAIYTKRGGHVLFNHVLGKGPGVSGIRHGGRGKFNGNRLTNVDRVVINGPDHEVLGNYVRARRGLLLESEHFTPGGAYNAADRALVVGNDAILTVGYQQPDSTLVRPVDGVQIYNHVGSVILAQQVNTNWVQEPRPDMAYPQPITLQPGQVGPDAP